MSIRFDDIGNRLKAFRLASGLSADQIAKRLRISRAALYRFEKGELAKIETLDKLAELLGVSVPTLLGVGVEYLPSAVAYFERLRQLEETASHIIVLAGPISYLLASDQFVESLDAIAIKTEQIMAILRERKTQYRVRRPAVVNLIAASEIERFLQNGLAGRLDLPAKERRERQRHARAEVEHFVAAIDEHRSVCRSALCPTRCRRPASRSFASQSAKC